MVNFGRSAEIQERTEERTRQCMELRAKGFTLRQVGEIVGISHVAVQHRLQDGYDRAVIPAVEEARKLECDRLDHLLERLADKIEAGDVKAIMAAIRISESRSRLLGLNAPQRVDAVIQEPPAPPHIIELLDEARARVAVDEAEISAQTERAQAGNGVGAGAQATNT